MGVVYPEPARPGISAGHNEAVAWACTPLRDDRAQILAVETDPADANRYRDNGEWRVMEIEREPISGKGKPRLTEDVVGKRTGNGVIVWAKYAGQRGFGIARP